MSNQAERNKISEGKAKWRKCRLNLCKHSFNTRNIHICREGIFLSIIRSREVCVWIEANSALINSTQRRSFQWFFYLFTLGSQFLLSSHRLSRTRAPTTAMFGWNTSRWFSVIQFLYDLIPMKALAHYCETPNGCVACEHESKSVNVQVCVRCVRFADPPLPSHNGTTWIQQERWEMSHRLRGTCSAAHCMFGALECWLRASAYLIIINACERHQRQVSNFQSNIHARTTNEWAKDVYK